MSYFPKSKTDKWMTPPSVYIPLNEEFQFTFDPCPIEWNEKTHDDGLAIEWGERNFINPPYSNVSKWIKKAHDEWKKGKLVVMLINAITDSIAFHEYIYGKAELRFVKGRIKFLDQDRKAVGHNVRPSMIVIFRP